MAGGETKQRIGELEAQIVRLKEAQPILRDQLAMAAMNGYISCNARFSIEDVVKSAYLVADKMLEARDAQG